MDTVVLDIVACMINKLFKLSNENENVAVDKNGKIVSKHFYHFCNYKWSDGR